MQGEFVTISDEEFVREATSIVDKAREHGIVIRIHGALATYLHSQDLPDVMKLYGEMQRFGEGKPKFTDLDLMAYSAQRNAVKDFFEKTIRFKPDIRLNTLFGYKRLTYYHPQNYYHVDVFFDKLEFSHDVVFGSKPGSGRLELDYPTINLADIILAKVQIHQLTLKDIVDLIILLTGHDIGTKFGKEIANVLSDDWGFWYDATNNLSKIKKYATAFHNDSKLPKEQYELVVDRVDRLMKIIDETQKTKKWQKRAETGMSKPWYREVEEVVR